MMNALKLSGNDQLDIGSCAFLQNSASYTGEDRDHFVNSVDSGYLHGNKEDFAIDGIKATSIFTVFEDRLTESKKSASGSAQGVGTYQPVSALSELRRVVSTKIRRNDQKMSARNRSQTIHDGKFRFLSPASLPSILSGQDSGLKSADSTMSTALKASGASQSTLVSMSSETLLSEFGSAGGQSTARATPVPSLLSSEFLPVDEEFYEGECKRKIITSQPQALLTLLINPIVDHCYKDFTRDFLLTHRYIMSEEELWKCLITRFLSWSHKAEVSKRTTFFEGVLDVFGGMSTYEYVKSDPADNRILKPWILADSDALEILLRYIFFQSTDR
jgi:hypothetical protein